MLRADLTPSATPFGNNPFRAPCRSLELEWPSAPAANCEAGSNPAFEARRMQEAKATCSAHGSQRSCREELQLIGKDVRGLDPGVFPTATPGVKEEALSHLPPGKVAAHGPLEGPALWRGCPPGVACPQSQACVTEQVRREPGDTNLEKRAHHPVP